MTLDPKVVTDIASLVRITIDDEARAEALSDFQKIMRFIDALNQVDTRDVRRAHRGALRLREDRIAGEVGAKVLLDNAPAHDEEFFLVPKVIE